MAQTHDATCNPVRTVKQIPLCMHCKKNVASAVWNVTYKRGYVKPKLFCASCGMTEYGNRLVMVENKASGEVMWVRDVERVDFVAHISHSHESYQPKMFVDATEKIWSIQLRKETDFIVQYRVAKNYSGDVVAEHATGEKWPAAK